MGREVGEKGWVGMGREVGGLPESARLALCSTGGGGHLPRPSGFCPSPVTVTLTLLPA